MITRPHMRRGREMGGERRDVTRKTTSRIKKARKYRTPANTSGGISLSPNLIRTHDVAHRKAMNSPCRMAVSRLPEVGREFMMRNLSSGGQRRQEPEERSLLVSVELGEIAHELVCARGAKAPRAGLQELQNLVERAHAPGGLDQTAPGDSGVHQADVGERGATFRICRGGLDEVCAGQCDPIAGAALLFIGEVSIL